MKTTTNTENEPTITWVIEAKFKDLTDEEILESANKIHARIPNNIGNDFLLISFARAILRKAQEK
jgi:hypothetical protein